MSGKWQMSVKKGMGAKKEKDKRKAALHDKEVLEARTLRGGYCYIHADIHWILLVS